MKGNSTRVCCENCYFRHAELCALQLSEACPTFRPHTNAAFSQKQAVRLAPRPLGEVVRAQLKVAAA
jgi:hypothetical protein